MNAPLCGSHGVEQAKRLHEALAEQVRAAVAVRVVRLGSGDGYPGGNGRDHVEGAVGGLVEHTPHAPRRGQVGVGRLRVHENVDVAHGRHRACGVVRKHHVHHEVLGGRSGEGRVRRAQPGTSF